MEKIKEYIEYFDEIGLELTRAEDTVNRIKNSEQYKKAYNYMLTAKKRGKIKELPNNENGYRVREIRSNGKV